MAKGTGMSDAQRACAHAGNSGKAQQRNKGKKGKKKKGGSPPKAVHPYSHQTAPSRPLGNTVRRNEDFQVNTTEADSWARAAPLPVGVLDDIDRLNRFPGQLKDFDEGVARRLMALSEGRGPLDGEAYTNDEVEGRLKLEMADPNYIRDGSGAYAPFLGPLYERMTPGQEMFLEANPQWYDAVVSSGSHAPGGSPLDDQVMLAVQRAMSTWWNTGKTPRPPRPFNTQASAAAVSNGMAAAGSQPANNMWLDGLMSFFKISMEMLPMILSMVGGAA